MSDTALRQKLEPDFRVAYDGPMEARRGRALEDEGFDQARIRDKRSKCRISPAWREEVTEGVQPVVLNRTFFTEAAPFRVLAILAALGVVWLSPQPASACAPGYGDVDDSGQVDVNDIQCLILVALAMLAGPPTELPSCAQGDPTAVGDLNCSGAINATDVAINIALALGSNLGTGVDWNGDGCPDACQDAAPCGAVAELSCGDSLTVDTSGGTNQWNTYGCAPWDESGKELRYVLNVGDGAEVSVALSNFSAGADLDVFILGLSCTTGECLASGDNTATANLVAGAYLVVVDGFEGSVGTATLTVSCTSPCNEANPCAGGKCGQVQCGDDVVNCGGCEAGLVCGGENTCVPEPAGPSCLGSCGQQSPDGCWCDDQCFGFGDCCPDVCEWCIGDFPAQCASAMNCGNGTCEPNQGENCSTCAADCGCTNGTICQGGACVEPGGGCFGACGGQSPDGCYCDDLCFGFGDCCENVCATCAESFPAQCGVQPPNCGDGTCNTAEGESCSTCPADCGCPNGSTCENGSCVAPTVGCNGHCGEQSPDGCWCDSGCFGFGDCCGNVCQFCAADYPAECAGPLCGDGVCEAGENSQNCPTDCPPTPTSNCCVNQGSGNTGCENAACTQCVCAADPFCCATQWDGICASAAQPDGACGASCPCAGEASCGNGVCEPAAGETPQTCPADCTIPTTCGDGVCSAALGENSATCATDCPEASDCCFPNGTPGCTNTSCETCVCGADPFCCDTGWDDICTDAALEGTCALACGCGVQGCGDGSCDGAGETPVTCPEDCTPGPTCGNGVCEAGETAGSCPSDCGGGGSGDCCIDNGTPGCSNLACQGCVCPLDSFCCESAWDNLCAGAAADECKNACGCSVSEPVCGNGACEVGETPANCSVDCGPPAENCCASKSAPGCAGNAACQSCVCEEDPFCCNSSWDSICASAAASDCGGACGCN